LPFINRLLVNVGVPLVDPNNDDTEDPLPSVPVRGMKLLGLTLAVDLGVRLYREGDAVVELEAAAVEPIAEPTDAAANCTPPGCAGIPTVCVNRG